MKRDRSRNGGILFEALAALAVLLIMLPTLARLWDMGVTEIRKRAVASHLKEVASASSSYARDNYESLRTSATASTAVRVTMDQLGPYLPTSFQQKNGWGQTYGIYVLEPEEGELLPVVLTFGGHPVDKTFVNTVVPSTAALVGGEGGYIPSGDLPGQKSTELRGAFGGWVVPLAGTNIPNPGPGHLGAMASLDANDLSQDFLYRVKIPGKPELNEMATELDMTDHAIRGVREIQFEEHSLSDIDASGFCGGAGKEGRVFFDREHGLYLCRNGVPRLIPDTGNSALLTDTTLAVDGQLIPKPECPPGTTTQPEIILTPSIVAQGEDASSIVAVQAWATDEGDNWRVHLRVLTTDESAGWIHPDPDYGRVSVVVTCQ